MKYGIDVSYAQEDFDFNQAVYNGPMNSDQL